MSSGSGQKRSKTLDFSSASTEQGSMKTNVGERGSIYVACVYDMCWVTSAVFGICCMICVVCGVCVFYYYQ